MSSHVRKQIRDGVKSRLKTVDLLSSRVFDASRMMRSFQEDEFPVALVAVSESADLGDKNPAGNRTLLRNITIDITLAVRDEMADAEDALDELSVAVEKALVMPSSIGVGKLMFWRYAGSSMITPQPTQDGLMLAQTLTYLCSVYTLDTAPDTNLHPA